MKNILVIFTGGTIGSRKDNKKINVDSNLAYVLLEEFQKLNNSKNIHFDTLHPYNILSENLIPSDWLILKKCLSEVEFTKYDGIIITHGTDTLPYTSAAISYLFRDTNIPIVLTASNYPLGDERSRGLRNFSNSVDFIINNPKLGVFVVFENQFGESIVYLGTRLSQALPFTDEFDSPNAVPFGKMKDGKFFITEDPTNISMDQLLAIRERKLPLEKIHFSPDILYIKPYPGIGYHYFDFHKRKPKAILHDLYHSGTACTREVEDQHFAIKEFMDYCNKHGVAFFIAPFKNTDGDLYLSSHKLIEYGAIPLENISVEASIVKLMMAYGTFTNQEDIFQFIKSELFFEVIK